MTRQLPEKDANAAAAACGFAWPGIDTVLVDMDGTLLDLAFDNFFWLELVPRAFAVSRGLAADVAAREIKARYARVVGTLPWYCLDYWSGELGLDLVRLKREHRDRIRFLPMVPDFLGTVRERGKRLLLVTNAHPQTLAVKIEQTGLDRLVDGMFSSHEFAVPKESRVFWKALERREAFDPARTLLLEDSLPVLAAARRWGIRHTVAVGRPDSTQPARRLDWHAVVEGVAELI